MKRSIAIVFALIFSLSLLAQEPPRELCVGETGFASWQPPINVKGLQGYRLWLDNIELGDIDTTEYQIDTDTLIMYQGYTFYVAAVYSNGISESISHSFDYRPCYYYESPSNFQGTFVDENTVELTWANYTYEFWSEINRWRC